VPLRNKALIKKMLVFGYSFNSCIFVDAVKRASALGSIQQQHFHSFMRCLAANDNRGESLARTVILALLRMEAQVRSGLGPQARASRIRRPHDMVVLKRAETAEVSFGQRKADPKLRHHRSFTWRRPAAHTSNVSSSVLQQIDLNKGPPRPSLPQRRAD
jgi:hypothetical protein